MLKGIDFANQQNEWKHLYTYKSMSSVISGESVHICLKQFNGGKKSNQQNYAQEWLLLSVHKHWYFRSLTFKVDPIIYFYCRQVQQQQQL